MEITFFPSSQRSSEERRTLAKKTQKVSSSYRKFGYDYFDNKQHSIGYKGYEYDGRFKAIAERMISHYDLKEGSYVAEVGCAKGFLLYEFHKLGMNIRGFDLSNYAVTNCIPELSEFIYELDACNGLPLPDKSIDLLISKEMLPHIKEADLSSVMREFDRIAKNIFVEIQCVKKLSDAELFLKWDPTHNMVTTRTRWINMISEFMPNADFSFRTLV